MTQAEKNPFPYSDSNKRYYTYDYYLRAAMVGRRPRFRLTRG